MSRPRALAVFPLATAGLAALIAFACQSTGGRSAAAKRYDVGTLLASLRLGGASISPDGSKVLFASNQSGVINAYEVPFGGGKSTAVTQSTTDSIQPLRYFPGD